MNPTMFKSAAILAIGFIGGVFASNMQSADASNPGPDMASKKFIVSIDEIKQNFVFGEAFSGTYTRTVKLSDGTERVIQLTPMVHDGIQVVEFKDNDGHTYMGLNGTTTNGSLMVQLRSVDDMKALSRAQGWPSAATD